jgi:hypothetical protein
MDAKQIVERNKQYNEESKKQEQEMISRIKPTTLGHWADILNTTKDINIKRNISKLRPEEKQEEVGMLTNALPSIIREMGDLQIKINQDLPPTHSTFSFFGSSEKTRQQKNLQERAEFQNKFSELSLLQKDIQEQSRYYKGGTRKLRRKRIKRSRVR